MTQQPYPPEIVMEILSTTSLPFSLIRYQPQCPAITGYCDPPAISCCKVSVIIKRRSNHHWLHAATGQPRPTVNL
ncbi:hypothetical protein KCP74_02500 [Salmonella enterica subsp. enterica]|nr:hypothetical protein KCP74_02500 [Salmonella enterica subsp. enterica]